MNYETELKSALDVARAAGAIHLDMRSKLNCIIQKTDKSPVTEVDRACENLIRDELLKAFPCDGFLGEETGDFKGSSGRKWIIDPLDGTRPYIHKIPTSSVLVALTDGEEPVAGVIHLPFLNETYWAVKGGGAFLNGDAIHVSNTDCLNRAMGSALGIIETDGTAKSGYLMNLMKSCDYAYGFMDAYSYGCIAAGRLDFCVNLLDKPWDCAAASCIVSEAGGQFSDISGLRSVHNGSIVLSNGVLHENILEYFVS